MLVTKEITANLPALCFYSGQPINRPWACYNNINAQCNTNAQSKLCDFNKKKAHWEHTIINYKPEVELMFSSIWGL